MHWLLGSVSKSPWDKHALLTLWWRMKASQDSLNTWSKAASKRESSSLSLWKLSPRESSQILLTFFRKLSRSSLKSGRLWAALPSLWVKLAGKISNFFFIYWCFVFPTCWVNVSIKNLGRVCAQLPPEAKQRVLEISSHETVPTQLLAESSQPPSPSRRTSPWEISSLSPWSHSHVIEEE